MTRRPPRLVRDLDDDPPTVAEYLEALQQVWPTRRNPDEDLAMLRAQVLRGGRITAAELADDMGYSNFIAANGRYGRLGHAIADALGIGAGREGGWYGAISLSWSVREHRGGRTGFVWELRPTFERALQQFPPTRGIYDRVQLPVSVVTNADVPEEDVLAALDDDFTLAAKEGGCRVASRTIRIRSALVAQQFVADREGRGTFVCDECGFDPEPLARKAEIPVRSLMDVHHRDPLAEGRRLTTCNDFELLCPTCHRLRHAVMRTVANRAENGG
ncbi:HNH endonuclease [Stella sp.]|uniref:HNH endonuclease n=1 Tax=Stella sp. TaxID=2912054 RepID=UPI0035B0EC3D